MKREQILIIGTGALATLFAARLSAVDISVTMLGTWPNGLTILRKRGVRIDGGDRSFPVHATNDPDECGGMRYAIVLVKTWQTDRAARQLSTCLLPEGIALTLQNGLGNDVILAEVLGWHRVVRGVTTLGATLLAPGLVCLGGEGSISIESHSNLSLLTELIKLAGFTINLVDNVQSLVWGKLVISSAINPLTALLRVKNGELLKNPVLRELMRKLACESAQVARTTGIELPFQDAGFATEEVAQRTAENQSSMLQDILRGAPTEIDAINGKIFQLAEQNNINATINRTVWSLVSAIPVRGKIEN